MYVCAAEYKQATHTHRKEFKGLVPKRHCHAMHKINSVSPASDHAHAVPCSNQFSRQTQEQKGKISRIERRN